MYVNRRLETIPGQHIRNIQIKSHGIEIPLAVAHSLPNGPAQAISPVDEIEMSDVHQRASVLAPATAGHADEAVIGALGALHDAVALAEGRPERRKCCGGGGGGGGAEGEVFHVGEVWGPGVEIFREVFAG